MSDAVMNQGRVCVRYCRSVEFWFRGIGMESVEASITTEQYFSSSVSSPQCDIEGLQSHL